MLVGIKYCGGCRAAYDRKSEAEKTIAAVKDSDEGPNIQFVSASGGESYNILLAVCGCLSRCLDISPYKADTTVYLYEEGGAADAAEKIIATQGG